MSHLAATRSQGEAISEVIPEDAVFPKPYRSSLLEKPLYSKVPDLKHFARLVINRYNLRNYTESRDIEYIRAYPYPIWEKPDDSWTWIVWPDLLVVLFYKSTLMKLVIVIYSKVKWALPTQFCVSV